MPIRKKTAMKRLKNPLTPGETNWIYDLPHETPWIDRHFMDKSDYAALWKHHRDDVLAFWLKERPCTRPSNWWRYDSPEKHLSAGESQAAYLQRHNLLTTAEVRYLGKHPELLVLEEVTP